MGRPGACLRVLRLPFSFDESALHADVAANEGLSAALPEIPLTSTLFLLGIRWTEPNRVLSLGRLRSRKLFQSFEENGEVFLVLTELARGGLFEVADPFLKLLVVGCSPTDLYEGAHDLNVHGNRSLTAKDAGKHRNTLLSEDIWLIAATAMSVS